MDSLEVRVEYPILSQRFGLVGLDVSISYGWNLNRIGVFVEIAPLTTFNPKTDMEKSKANAHPGSTWWLTLWYVSLMPLNFPLKRSWRFLSFLFSNTLTFVSI